MVTSSTRKGSVKPPYTVYPFSLYSKKSNGNRRRTFQATNNALKVEMKSDPDGPRSATVRVCGGLPTCGRAEFGLKKLTIKGAGELLSCKWEMDRQFLEVLVLFVRECDPREPTRPRWGGECCTDKDTAISERKIGATPEDAARSDPLMYQIRTAPECVFKTGPNTIVLSSTNKMPSDTLPPLRAILCEQQGRGSLFLHFLWEDGRITTMLIDPPYVVVEGDVGVEVVEVESPCDSEELPELEPVDF